MTGNNKDLIKQPRLDYVDVCKAIGILLVILGHTYYGPQVLYNVIFCFHMPLFFILSGFTFNRFKNQKLSFKEYTIKKTKELLLPYLILGISNLVIQIIWKSLLIKESINTAYIFNNLKGILLCYSSAKYMPNCTPIWFLVCLFFSNLLLWLLMKLDGKNRIVAAFLILFSGFVFSSFVDGYTTFPWKFPVFLIGTFLMYSGYLLRRYLNDKCNLKRVAAICGALLILGIGVAIELITGNSVGMNESQYGNILIFLLTSIPISMSVIVLCKYLPIPFKKQLIWLGRNTIYIVGFNYLCRDIATEIYYLIPVIKNHQVSYLPLFLLTLGVSIIWIFICKFAVRNLHLLLNKNRI